MGDNLIISCGSSYFYGALILPGQPTTHHTQASSNRPIIRETSNITIEENTATTNSGSYDTQSVTTNDMGIIYRDHKIIDEDDRQLHQYDDKIMAIINSYDGIVVRISTKKIVKAASLRSNDINPTGALTRAVLLSLLEKRYGSYRYLREEGMSILITIMGICWHPFAHCWRFGSQITEADHILDGLMLMIITSRAQLFTYIPLWDGLFRSTFINILSSLHLKESRGLALATFGLGFTVAVGPLLGGYLANVEDNGKGQGGEVSVRCRDICKHA
eukprot:scaffold5947_cov67-Skeletonema_dohrnii-CCMP3373.AAC.1